MNLLHICLVLLIFLVVGCVAEKYVIQTSSNMEPTIKKGEKIKIEPIDLSTLKENDIVVVKIPQISNPIVTRVIHINKTYDFFIGKGDGNPEPMFWEKQIFLKYIQAKVVDK